MSQPVSSSDSTPQTKQILTGLIKQTKTHGRLGNADYLHFFKSLDNVDTSVCINCNNIIILTNNISRY
jgi:hypothetical protein